MAIVRFERNMTSTFIAMYSLLYLYFLGSGLRNTSKVVVIFKDEKRNYRFIWNWIQRVAEYPIFKRVSAFVIDETIIQIRYHHFWLWFCIEPIHKSVLGIHISEERNMIVSDKKFIRSLVEKNRKHIVYTDGDTWYDETYNVLGLKHYLHSQLKKSLMEIFNQYFKDRIKSFDDYSISIYNKKANAIYFIYITGCDSFLFLCIIIQQQ